MHWSLESMSSVTTVSMHTVMGLLCFLMMIPFNMLESVQKKKCGNNAGGLGA